MLMADSAMTRVARCGARRLTYMTSLSLFEALELHIPRGYTIQGKLGGGATSVVYLAGLPGCDSDRLAVKVLLEGNGTNQASYRFLREMQVLEKLHHPRIPRILEPGEANGRLFFTMPYIDGQTLGAYLRSSGRLSLKESLLIARDIGEALDHAHARGVVHRDVKPDNIYLADDGAYLMDFGLAITSDSERGSGTDWDGTVAGTPAYMSPEQASGNHVGSWRSDFFSLGCVLHEMLTGQRAFASTTVREALERHRMGVEAPEVRSLRPEVTEEVSS